MNCSAVQAWLERYADRETDAETAAALQSHLRTCDACQRRVSEQQLHRDAVNAQFQFIPAIRPSADFDIQVLNRLSSAATRPLTVLDRLDNFFAHPIRKVIGAMALSSLLCGATILAATRNSALGPSSAAEFALNASTSTVPMHEQPNSYAALIREMNSGVSQPHIPANPASQQQAKEGLSWGANTGLSFFS